MDFHHILNLLRCCRASDRWITYAPTGAPITPANSRSNRLTFDPVVIQSDRRVSQDPRQFPHRPARAARKGKKCRARLTVLLALIPL